MPKHILRHIISLLQEDTLDNPQTRQNFDDSPLPTSKQLQNGTVLVGRYEIQTVIGVGGMGSVYRARDLHFPSVNKVVAVKEMIIQAPDPLVRETIVENFEREANILVTLSHPAIPNIFDYFTHDERSYLVLEFITGKDLEAVLNSIQGFVPEDQMIVWTIEICDVLSFLHNHKPEPIIFRDVKPSNIMINQQGHVVLIDFGIAKNFKVGQKGTMIGTEGYSPPEQYRGEATLLADIYALGATVHHLLTRRDPRIEPPFTFGERPIRQINPSVSPEFEKIIETALNYEPTDRFKSAEEMKEALIAVAGKTGALSRVTFGKAQPIKSQSVKPVWKFKCEDEIRGTATLHNDFVYTGSYDNNLYALNADTGEMLWKFPTEGGLVGKPLVSDEAIYIGSEDKNLYAISQRTGKLLWSFQTGGAIRSSPVLAEDYIFLGADDGFLYAIHVISKRDAWRFDSNGFIRSGPYINQDAVFFGNETGDVLAVDFRGNLRWRFRTRRSVLASPTIADGILVIGSLDLTLYGLDAKSGWPVWRFRMNRGTASTAAITEKMVFAGSADGILYCLNLETGKETWRYEMGEQISGSPLIYKDGLFVGGSEGTFACLEYRTGRLRWKYHTDGPISGTPCGYKDKVVIGSFDHYLYAFPVV